MMAQKCTIMEGEGTCLYETGPGTLAEASRYLYDDTSAMLGCHNSTVTVT